ncbi:MAG TPA: helix-turn-helix transcriptional regulator, partial [Polyangiaceae bacterium]|nr:helix-turn-helix transcriptional regulator [Polyangiaceae bacterium]
MEQALSLPANCQGDLFPVEADGAKQPLPHRHRELELNLLVRGSVRYLVGPRRCDLRPGDLLWLLPRDEHVIVHRSADVRLWVLVAAPSLIATIAHAEQYRALTSESAAGVWCRRLPEARASALEALLEEVWGKSDDPEHFNAGLSFVVTSAWRAYLAASDVPTGSSVHPAVERAARLIRDEVEPLRGPELSRAVHLSISRLSQLFHEQTGRTLSEFRNEQRLRRFFELYGAGRRATMTEAALEAGFGSYPQFYRVFRRRRDESPGDYRRALLWG